MPDKLDKTGLTVKTLTEIVNDLTTGMQGIYGNDINVDQNSPDGQLINLFGQACEDIRELLVQINNDFDPDLATGAILDQRVAINNIIRQGGTYTIQPVDITVSQTVELAGLDGEFDNPNGTGFTVQDNIGNKYILVDTTTLTAGTHSLNFRAQLIGQVEPVIGTINIAVTVVIGVTAINNSSTALSIGQNQETDAQLRVRRQKSVALASVGYLNGLLGAVLALPGVNAAVLYENVADTVDANGIPAHGIWLVVDGGANTDIANLIYDKKSYGANMKGSVAVDIITASGSIFIAKFDRPSPENLYIEFNIQRTIPLTNFDLDGIKDYIVANLSYSIGQYAETSSITAVILDAINATSGGGVPLEVHISNDNATWVDFLDTDTPDKQFTLSQSNINITILI